MTENTSGQTPPPGPPPTGGAQDTAYAGQPGHAGQPGYTGGPRVTTEEMRDLTRLRRSSTDKHVAGVAGGLARHLDIDPVLVRVALVVLVFFGGAGLLLYGALWLLVPADDEPTAKIDLDSRTRSAALVLVGVIAALAMIGDAFDPHWFPWPLAILGVIVWVVLSGRNRKREQTPYAAGHQQGWVGPQAPPVTQPGWVGDAGSGAGYGAGPGTGYGTGYGSGYGSGASAHTPEYTPPAGPSYVAPPRPRNPRKRGPKLFWFTLALIALSLGALGVLDGAGLEVADSAYPALALAVVGVMLLVGAFYGRAGGLILLGLVASVGLAGSTASEHWDGDQVKHAPTSAGSVEEEYWTDAGELTVDLSGIRDLAGLDGRSIDIGLGAGRIEVIVPPGVDVEVDAEVGGPGEVTVFGSSRGGLHVELDDTRAAEGTTPAPDLELDIFAGVGEIVVRNP